MGMKEREKEEGGRGLREGYGQHTILPNFLIRNM